MFRFQTFGILNFQEICPKLEHSGWNNLSSNQTILGPIVQNSIDLVRILDVCLKTEHFDPFVLLIVQISDVKISTKSKQNGLDFGCHPITEPSENGTK